MVVLNTEAFLLHQRPTPMFNPFDMAQGGNGGGGDEKTFLGENQPHIPTTGALRYSDDTELYA